MIIQTEQQRKNTLEALDVMWPTVPPKNVSRELGMFRQDARRVAPGCQTIACFGGWVAWWPGFVAQGILVGDEGKPVIEGSIWASDASQFLFGESAMFSSRGGLDCDDDFKGTDHELVTHRLKWLLENSKVAA